MPVIEDQLWKSPGKPGMIVVSSHAAISPDGRLYMGYGAAQEATQRIPGIEYQCGNEILSRAVDGVYGFLPIRPSHPGEKQVGFGIFQTRLNWDESANRELIRYSMEGLRRYAQQNRDLKIRMNFPGIGWGGLSVDEVSRLLLPLPQTVTICHQGEIRPSIPSNFAGFKPIYLKVEHMLQDGRFDQAVEFLLDNGYDIQSAFEQAQAVQRLLKERKDKDIVRMRKWRGITPRAKSI